MMSKVHVSLVAAVVVLCILMLAAFVVLCVRVSWPFVDMFKDLKLTWPFSGNQMP